MNVRDSQKSFFKVSTENIKFYFLYFIKQFSRKDLKLYDYFDKTVAAFVSHWCQWCHLPQAKRYSPTGVSLKHFPLAKLPLTSRKGVVCDIEACLAGFIDSCENYTSAMVPKVFNILRVKKIGLQKAVIRVAVKRHHLVKIL
jgi:hypothetical protein